MDPPSRREQSAGQRNRYIDLYHPVALSRLAFDKTARVNALMVNQSDRKNRFVKGGRKSFGKMVDMV
jgi:hypothetical protein